MPVKATILTILYSSIMTRLLIVVMTLIEGSSCHVLELEMLH